MAPSSFASAAAGNSNSDSTRQTAPGDWNRRANGATQTFRRPSLATNQSGTSSSLTNRNSSENPGVYIPPHRNGTLAEHRYSKEQLLQLFQNQEESNDFSEDLENLYVSGWEPSVANGVTGGSWARRDEQNKDHPLGADVCWEKDGTSLPLSLQEMTEEEKEHFMHVNSLIKPPTQSMSKDGTTKDGLSLRKSSVSQANSSGSYGLSSPTSTRPQGRRRDTSDSFPFPNTASPATSRFSRDESSAATPPPALLRRRTDFKENDTISAMDEKDKEKSGEPGPSFGGLKRSTTGGFGTSANTAASPWSTTQGGGFPPMGSFGSFALGGTSGSTSAAGDKRPSMGSMRTGSRFKDLMSKDPLDEKKDLQEKISLPNLGAVSEQEQLAPSWNENRPTSKDTDPFPDDELRGGSAALGGGLDTSPPRSRAFPGFGPSRQDSREESLFGAFGMTSDTVPFPGLLQQRDFTQQTPQQRSDAIHEPMSPTDTNPFQSPDNDKSELDDLDTDAPDLHHAHLPGLGGFGADQSLPGLGGFGTIGRGSGSLEASDRSQTSSAGARGLPAFGSLGGLPGLGGPSPWATTAGSIGTPTRDRSGFSGAFGESLFSSAGEGLSGLGSSSFLGTAAGPGHIGAGTIGRTGGSRIGYTYPQNIQEQFRGSESGRQSLDDSLDALERQQGLVGAIGRGAFGPGTIGASAPMRDADSPFRSGRGIFDDGFAASHGPEPTSALGPPMESAFAQGQTSASMQQPIPALAAQASFPGHRSDQSQSQQQVSNVASPSSNQPPVAQVRQMVMPDRMKWVYKDPDGNIQGPFSGLEMHDWYKAGFFTPELLLKKLEDPEYEPLAQLIRRIGNSREPFLVPQIGVPHDPPLTQRSWSGSVSGPAPGTQAPFPNSFPSFGTTLTAEQQNALERRKQEEQYLMARQKEHLAQQQLLMRQQMQMPVQSQAPSAPSGLHHHSSAHSLHSQPSFGSITSPGGYQASPTQGPMLGGQPVPGFFDGAFPSASGGGLGLRNAGGDALPNIREEELPGFMERLSVARQAQAQAPGIPLGQQQSTEPAHAQQIQQMMSDRARLQAEQEAQQSHVSREQERMMLDRYQQFQDLRGPQEPDPHSEELAQHEGLPPPLARRQPMLEPLQTDRQQSIEESMALSKHPEQPSLTEQVQKAQSAKERAQKTVWNQVDPATMQPITRQDTSSPMPAPIAQRKANVAETLAAESRSRSQTPSVDTPSASIAPWAKETIEAPKGPSFKELQEMEARKAAQQEELQAAARKAAFEKELQAQAAAAQQTAHGLPSTSIWGNNQSPGSSSVATPSVWSKSSAKIGAVQPATAKKTLAQIQKEEEVRKQKILAAAQAAQATSPGGPPGLSSSKTYAGLVGKNVPPAAVPSGGSAWTTVGAGGKVKAPAAPIPTSPARATSSNTVPSMPSASGAPGKPKGPQRSTTMGGGASSNKTNALEEFKKWAARELNPHLNKDISNGKLKEINGFRVRAKKFTASDFVENLVAIGNDVDVITEAVHSSSNSIESRHFAEEFVRRKKLADKGVVDASSLGGTKESAGGSNEGWSEVAKKNPVKEEAPNNFKVVAGKKKGGRK